MSDTALVVMARYPEAGKTKTRLARNIGNTETAALYQAFLTDIAQHFSEGDCDLHWAYTPAEIDYHAFVSTLVPTSAHTMRCFPQQGADLGARLHHVFQWTHAHGFQNSIVIGSDSPHITSAMIASARKALDEADVVLGPADDGGYYLIAMRKPYDVFSGILMSTPVVTQMTMEAAERQGLKTHLIEPLFDIDEFPDLLRLAHLLAADSSLAPTTAAYLASMRNLHDYDTYSNTPALNLH